MRHDLQNHTQLQRFIGFDHAARIGQVGGHLMPKPAQKEPAARIARNDPEVQEDFAEFRFFRRDAHVAHHRQIASRPDRGTVDGGNGGNVEIIKRLGQKLHPIDVALRRSQRLLAEDALRVVHFLDVATCTKRRIGAGQDHDADVRVGLNTREGVEQSGDHGVSGDRITTLWIVQRYCSNAVFNVQLDKIITHFFRLHVPVCRTSRD